MGVRAPSWSVTGFLQGWSREEQLQQCRGEGVKQPDGCNLPGMCRTAAPLQPHLFPFSLGVLQLPGSVLLSLKSPVKSSSAAEQGQRGRNALPTLPASPQRH